MDETLAIKIEGLKKAYGEVRALRGVDLEVRRGEILGFLGPNGAGKTTTIRCLLDLIRPDAGTIRILGLDPGADSVAVRRRVGYLPGELSLEANLTAEGVIQALMARPDLLLLDEPTSGLDPLMQREVYRLLGEAKADGATIFFSSHIIGEVEAIAERVAIIRQGIIVEEAEPDSLVNMALRRIRLRFRQPVDPEMLGSVDGVKLLSREDDTGITLQVEGEVDALIKALAAFPVVDLQTEHPSLEEIFLAYYKSDETEVH